jgi:hypothetical protein
VKLPRTLNWKTLWVFMIAILLTGCRHARDISGDWQGTLAVPQGRPIRVVLKISRNQDGDQNAKFYRSIKQQTNTRRFPLPCTIRRQRLCSTFLKPPMKASSVKTATLLMAHGFKAVDG